MRDSRNFFESKSVQEVFIKRSCGFQKKDNQKEILFYKIRKLFFTRLWFTTHRKHKRKGKETKKMDDSIEEVDPSKSHIVDIHSSSPN